MTLLTAPDCHLCEQAKDVLERLSGEYGFDVETVALTSERGHQLAAGAGILFPPGVLLDGRPFSYGRLSERKLRQELKRSTTIAGDTGGQGEPPAPDPDAARQHLAEARQKAHAQAAAQPVRRGKKDKKKGGGDDDKKEKKRKR